MQFLLTEDEYSRLVPEVELEQAKSALKWCFEKLQPSECPHRKENYRMAYPYCDTCPIDNLDDRTMSKLICRHSRNHSK